MRSSSPFGTCGTGGADFSTFSLSKSATAEVTAGDAVSYQLGYQSQGQAGVDNVTVTDTLPSGLTYVPDSANPAPSVSGSTLTWNLGHVSGGTTGTISFQATTDPAMDSQTVQNCAQATYADSYSIQKSTQSCATTQVDVTDPRQIVFVHGINDNARTIASGNGWSALLGPVRHTFGDRNVRIFFYYQDRAYAVTATNPPKCGSDAPGPDARAGSVIPVITDYNSVGIKQCDSQSDLGLNAAALGDFVNPLVKPHRPIAVIANSMGGAITRGWITYEQRKRDQAEDHSLDGTDTAIFLEGAQQGSYIAKLAPGINKVSSLTKVFRAVAQAVAKKVHFYPRRPAGLHLAPRSVWYRTVNRWSVPGRMHYFNVYGDIRVKHTLSALSYAISVPNPIPYGDGVMLPGEDNPTATPNEGGAKFLPPGPPQDRHEWSVGREYVARISKGTVFPDIGDVLNDPAMHLNFADNVDSSKLQIDNCKTGQPTTPTHRTTAPSPLLQPSSIRQGAPSLPYSSRRTASTRETSTSPWPGRGSTWERYRSNSRATVALN